MNCSLPKVFFFDKREPEIDSDEANGELGYLCLISGFVEFTTNSDILVIPPPQD